MMSKSDMPGSRADRRATAKDTGHPDSEAVRAAGLDLRAARSVPEMRGPAPNGYSARQVVSFAPINSANRMLLSHQTPADPETRSDRNPGR